MNLQELDTYIHTISRAHALDIRRRKLSLAAIKSQDMDAADAFEDLDVFYSWMQKHEPYNRHLAYTSLATWKIHLKHYVYVLGSIYTAEERLKHDWPEHRHAEGL